MGFHFFPLLFFLHLGLVYPMELLDCLENLKLECLGIIKIIFYILLSPKTVGLPIPCSFARLAFCLNSFSLRAQELFINLFFFLWMLFLSVLRRSLSFQSRHPNCTTGVVGHTTCFNTEPFSFYRNVPKNSIKFFIRDVFVKFSSTIPIMVQPHHSKNLALLLVCQNQSTMLLHRLVLNQQIHKSLD